MNHVAALASVLAIAAADASAQFTSANLVDEGQALEYRSSDGRVARAPKMKDQVEFDLPRVSLRGGSMGWLALYPGSSTSYPIPLKLVVMDQKKRLHTFSGPQAIFGWCFSQDGAAVSYRQAALHGPTEQTFEMRRVSDGKRLQSFVQPWQGPDADDSAAKVPRWARCTLDQSSAAR